MVKLKKASKTVKRTTYGTSGVFEVKANKRLRVKVSGDPEDIFNDKCPRGKLWRIKLSLEIHEVSA